MIPTHVYWYLWLRANQDIQHPASYDPHNNYTSEAGTRPGRTADKLVQRCGVGAFGSLPAGNIRN
jgi:hypothetical protein